MNKLYDKILNIYIIYKIMNINIFYEAVDDFLNNLNGNYCEEYEYYNEERHSFLTICADYFDLVYCNI